MASHGRNRYFRTDRINIGNAGTGAGGLFDF